MEGVLEAHLKETRSLDGPWKTFLKTISNNNPRRFIVYQNCNVDLVAVGSIGLAN